MNRRSISVLSAAALLCFAWTSSRSQLAEVAEPSQLPVGSTIRVTLVKGIDARENKAGDNVIARTTEDVKSEGHVLIPRGSHIVGRVSETKARSKEELQSTLAIIFDQAVLKDGREIPLALTIQAIAPPKPENSSDPSDSPRMTAATAGGLGGGRNLGPMSDPNAGVPGRVESPNSVYVPDGQLSSAGELTPSCHGVLGIDGVALSPESTNSSRGSLIISERHNVHLDARTQMMLRVMEK